MRRSTIRRTQMIAGVLLAIVGGSVVAAGLNVEWLIERWDEQVHTAVVLSGVGLILLGALVFAAGRWTAETGNRAQFFIPAEGRVYILIMIVLFCGSQIGTSNMLLMVFVAMAGPWIVNGWLTYTMLRRIQVSRLHPERVMAGDQFPVQIVLENQKRWISCWLMRLHDQVRGRSGTNAPEILFVRTPPQSRRAGEYRLSIRDRGRYTLGPININTRFPLGMVQRGRRFPLQGEILVYPRRGRLTPSWQKQILRATELADIRRTQSGIFHDDLHQLRGYRSGDDSRMIHWRTSARMNELMVCEYHESRDRDLVLLLDAWQPAHPTARDLEDFERGLRYALTLSTDFIRARKGSALAVVIVGNQTHRWQGGLEQQPLDALLDDLALVESTHAVAAATVVEHARRESGTGARLEVVTCRPEQIRDAAMDLPAEFAEHCVRGTSSRELADFFEDL